MGTQSGRWSCLPIPTTLHVARTPRPFSRKYFVLCVLVCTAFLLYTHFEAPTRASLLEPAAENSTLGFGAIYVLTEDTSTWRIQGLRKAARLTGLQISVPVQQSPTAEQLNTFLQANQAERVDGEIGAVINYLSLLEAFIQSGLGTALFVEDDVDFGLSIKAQMRLISDTMLAKAAAVQGFKSLEDAEGWLQAFRHEYPFGKDDWQVFWIGHFGVEYTAKSQIWYYRDPHALPWDHLFSNFNDYYHTQIGITADGEPKPQQLVDSVAPLATFAFALTREAAQMIVRAIRQDRPQKFDVALHTVCKGLGLRCVAPVPEVMHHHKVIGQSSIQEIGT